TGHPSGWRRGDTTQARPFMAESVDRQGSPTEMNGQRLNGSNVNSQKMKFDKLLYSSKFFFKSTLIVRTHSAFHHKSRGNTLSGFRAAKPNVFNPRP
ncbi:MAG TPA: hypothetical protein PLS70_23370, partial [Acidobacteriota bacterium]|nr:hypothetical protein [Acidobacteriota bacterium]